MGNLASSSFESQGNNAASAKPSSLLTGIELTALTPPRRALG